MQTLEQYIEKKHGSKAQFARNLGVFPQQITRWINAGYKVIDGKMMRVVRDFEDTEKPV
jgi:plasmid maintenance system antidote protein VapI